MTHNHTENTTHAATNIFRRPDAAVHPLRGVGCDARTQPLNRIAWPSPAACAVAFALGMASMAWLMAVLP